MGPIGYVLLGAAAVLLALFVFLEVARRRRRRSWRQLVADVRKLATHGGRELTATDVARLEQLERGGPPRQELEEDAAVRGFAGLMRRASSAARALRLNLRGGGWKLSASWRLEAYQGGHLRQAMDAGRNLFVDTGLDALVDRMLNPATAQALFGYLAIGTDATAEVGTDIALGAEIARSTGTVTATPGGTGVMTVDWTFPAALGWEPAAIVEAGLFDLAAAGVMLNRKTFAGFTKQAADTLKVVCVVQVTPA